MVNRKKFFDGIRSQPFTGKLKATTVKGISAILDEWERRGLSDLRWLAYMLATVLRECGEDMQPVREGFKKTDAEARAYVKRQKYKYAKVVNGQVYYGRGLVQLTWDYNYSSITNLLRDSANTALWIGVDRGVSVPPNLVKDPDLALRPDIAAFVMFEGMIRGTFTKKKLADYFTPTKTDWRNARRIVNGLDEADEVAANAKHFHSDLVLAAA